MEPLSNDLSDVFNYWYKAITGSYIQLFWYFSLADQLSPARERWILWRITWSWVKIEMPQQRKWRTNVGKVELGYLGLRRSVRRGKCSGDLEIHYKRRNNQCRLGESLKTISKFYKNLKLSQTFKLISIK